MDERWSMFAFTQSFEMFCSEALPEIYLKPAVPEDVKKNFRTVRSLLEKSYYDYELYDEAALKAMISLEMAINLRGKEVNAGFTEKTLLKTKMDWFNRRDYFEVYNDHYLDTLRKIRNHLVHPQYHGVGGPTKRHLITQPVNLINDLYEDPELRKTRKHFVKTANEVLLRLKLDGMELRSEDESHLVFEAWLFYDNKSAPNRIYFYWKPIYEISENFFEERKIYDSPTYVSHASEVQITSDRLVFKHPGSEDIILTSISTDTGKETFRTWQDLFRRYNNLVAERPHNNLFISKTFQKHMQDFYKLP